MLIPLCDPPPFTVPPAPTQHNHDSKLSVHSLALHYYFFFLHLYVSEKSTFRYLVVFLTLLLKDLRL